MEDTIDPHRTAAHTSRYGRRTALVAAPALAAVALVAGSSAGSSAHALAPKPHPAASPQESQRAERPARRTQHSAQPAHAVQQHLPQRAHEAQQARPAQQHPAQEAQQARAVQQRPAQQAHEAKQQSAQGTREAKGPRAAQQHPAAGAHEGHEPQAAEPPRTASHEGGQHSREAQGGHRAQEAGPRLVYDRPEEATGGSGVIWRWTVVNEGSRSADDVVATQKITSGHKVLGQSRPCASEHETIVCRYETMGAGERRTGWLKTSGSLKGGPLRLDARMTWRERPDEDAASHAGAETKGRHPGH